MDAPKKIFISVIVILLTTISSIPMTATARNFMCKVLNPYTIIETQSSLRQKGFDPGPLDGIMGPRTCSAITRFQIANHLVVDGIVGPKTAKTLGMSKSPHCGSNVSSCFLVIERKNYQGSLYVIQNGKVIKKLPATFGGTDHTTPLGSYTVTRAYAYSHTSTEYPSEEPNMNYPIYFLNGYAIHGSNSLGSRTGSHGCIRIGWQQSKQIYNKYYKQAGITTIVVRR